MWLTATWTISVVLPEVSTAAITEVGGSSRSMLGSELAIFTGNLTVAGAWSPIALIAL